MIFAERKDIEWISGWDEMRSYSFATEKKVHRFCGNCGSSVCMDFLGLWKAAGDVIGMNVSFSWRFFSSWYLHCPTMTGLTDHALG